MPISSKTKKAKDAGSRKKRLILLDAHAIIHRAYHALPDFTSSAGEPTGALYGLVAMLLKIAGELAPDYIVACYDLPSPTFRHQAYEGYKAGRKEIDDALARQLNRSRDVLTALAIPIYEKEGFEADDILGTIVERLKRHKNIDIIIASGDMDTLQLVDDARVRVYTLKKGLNDTILYDESTVEKRFGFGPDLLPDFKGLRGDPSDNIVGITGIGEKTATTLVQDFGSIREIYRALKKNREAFERAGISPRVISLLEGGEEEARFSRMLAEINRKVPIDFSLPEKTWRESVNTESVLALFSELNFRTLSDRVRSLFGERAPVDILGEAVAGEAIDNRELRETAIALWLLDSHMTDPELEDILQYAKVSHFAAARAAILTEVEEKGLDRVLRDIELPLVPVTQRMEERGIKIDVAYLAKLSEEYHHELAALERKIMADAGKEFNVNSPKQLGDILFDTLGLVPKNHKKTAGGARSTRESELEKLRDTHPIVRRILEHRELQKLLSTYIDTLPRLADEKGRVHTTFSQTGTTTGRMSSTSPNLQNIPIKTERGRRIRGAFVAEAGFTLVSLDYSQIELRIAAFLSRDEKLTRIFREGGDVHVAVAAEVFGVPPEHVDSEMRRRAKVINFGILYGMGINALRENLGTDRVLAQKFYNEYFKNFTGLARYIEGVKADAHRTGHVETYFGRRRSFEGIRSSLPYIRSAAERMAVNAPIQGTQADIIKIAMARADAYIAQKGFRDRTFLLLQVHDELLYEIENGLVSEVATRIKDIMETVLTREETNGIPLLVDVAAGKDWGNLRAVSRL